MAAETKPRYSKLMVTMQAPIARVILANPPVNVIDMPMMDELIGGDGGH